MIKHIPETERTIKLNKTVSPGGDGRERKDCPMLCVLLPSLPDAGRVVPCVPPVCHTELLGVMDQSPDYAQIPVPPGKAIPFPERGESTDLGIQRKVKMDGVLVVT